MQPSNIATSRLPVGSDCGERYLIVNADDYGLSSGINEGIVQCHAKGIVTSASLMVRPAAAKEAAVQSRSYSMLSVGLHLDLGEWICTSGSWRPIYEVVSTDDATAVEQELRRQLDVFRELLGRDPSHLDSHQHVHRHEPVRTLVRQLGRELRIPVRHYSPEVRFCGDFYGQTGDGQPLPESIAAARLGDLISCLPGGVTELGCHPGYADELETMYRTQRRQEIESLCSESVRQAVVKAGIRLISFSQLSTIGRRP